MEPCEHAADGAGEGAALSAPMRSMFLRTVMPVALALLAGVPGRAQSAAAPGLRKDMLVSTEWLAAHLHDPDLLVLSVGATPEFYLRGHIPGARQILLSEIAV